jgi:putative Mn2+ efflux pump MntP
MAGILTLSALGLSLSVDAFAAAIGKGATSDRPRFGQALRIGAVFGLAEAISPAIGWLIGRALSSWVMAVSDWVAFALLAAVGGHMLWMAWRGGGDDTAESEESRKKAGGIRLMLTAVATSIDAMAVGVSLAVLNVGIVSACIVIGLVTTVIATTGVLVGRHAGEKLGPLAEVLGGIVLIGIGAMILVQHYWMG